jgi:hypothetical protein
MNKKLILILTEQRTGSHLLNEALSFYSPIQAVNEFFLHPGFHQDKEITPYELLLTEYQCNQLFDFLNVEQGSYIELIKQVNLNPVKSLLKLYEISEDSLAVKIHRHQFEKYQLDELLNLSYVEIIILERSNRMARYISLLKANQTDIWHGIDTSKLQVVVDKDEFIKEEQQSLNWFNKIKQLVSSKDYLEVNYEKDLEDLNKDNFYNLFDPWFEKINLSVTKTNYKLKLFKKQNRSKIQYSILNYKEIKDLV